MPEDQPAYTSRIFQACEDEGWQLQQCSDKPGPACALPSSQDVKQIMAAHHVPKQLLVLTTKDIHHPGFVGKSVRVGPTV